MDDKHEENGEHGGPGRVREVWGRIAEVMPSDDINGPAAEEAVGDLESHVGQALPSDLRESLLLHDGTADAHGSFEIFGGWLLSVAEITATRDMLVEVSESSDMTFEKTWLPVTADGAGNGYCVDLDSGEVFDLDHEVGASEPKAPSFVALLEQRLDAR